MTATDIALNKLTLSPDNVRKTGASEGIGELVESIAAHGVLQNLIVRKAPRGKFAVVGGQRRHMALTILSKAGRLPADHPVPCPLIADEADAAEISLAENVVREPMHPADQFEAWRDLIDNRNMPVADIAARFGVSEKIVTQRMKLGRVAPALLELYRAGDMDLEQVMAFTLTDDHAAQLKVWDEAEGWQRNARNIRQALTKGEVAATDKRVRFVTLEDYEAAGGAVRRDLFDDKNSGYVLDTILLDRLVEQKLAHAYEAVLFEGWKWVELRPDFPYEQQQEFEQASMECIDLSPADEAELERLEEEEIAITACCENDGRDQPTPEEQDRLDHIERLKDAIEERRYAYPPEAKAYAGAVVTLTREGHPEIERGLIRPGDAPKASASGKAKKEKSPYSMNLRTSLRDFKAIAVAAELAGNPHVALAAVTHDLALKTFYPGAYRHCGAYLLNLSTAQIAQPKDSKAAKHLQKSRKKTGGRLPADMRDLWGYLLEQDDKGLMDIFAQAVATSICTGRMDTLIEALGFDLRRWFVPTTENYFGRIGKQALLADIADMGVAVTGGNRLDKLKKADLAAHAEIVLSREENAAWLPVPMRAEAHEPAPAEADEPALAEAGDDYVEDYAEAA